MAESDFIIDGYRRISVMQTGQNSEVWEVGQDGSHRRFAMKLLLPEKENDPNQRKMLRHEANVGMSLQHPNIIKIYSVSTSKHHPYILMEYFPSQNLKLRLLRKQFKEFIRPKLRSIIMQVSYAIEHMHEKKWVHRDIKPDNILVNAMGEIRLIDFALAVPLVTGFMKNLTRKRQAAGTRSYMSPEQIMGKPLDGRADIYSFGVVLFELVNGRLPYVAQSGRELLQKHVFASLPNIDPERNVTPEFGELVLSMLEKKEEDRPANFSEFRSKLRQIKIFNDEEIEA